MANIELVIKIPDNEFGIDINDKFQDFFKRLRAEIEEHLISGTELVCGAYELEIIEMFLSAFASTTPLPKGHGDLVDINDLLEQIGLEDTEENRQDNVGEIITLEDIDRLNVIIPAERRNTE